MEETFEGDGTSYVLSAPRHGNCNLMWTPPLASTNYAALNAPQWANLAHCGRCARVRCVDARCNSTATALVMLVDQCPECKHGDLDLSPKVFREITGHDATRLKVAWSFARCPIQDEHAHVCLKNGANPFWMAVQPVNVATGVQRVRINGFATEMLDSCYYFKANAGSAQIPLENMDVELTFLNGSSQHILIPSINASSCTNGYHEVDDPPLPNVQMSPGGSASSSVLMPALLVAAVLGGGLAALYVARRRRLAQQQQQASFRLVLPIEDEEAVL
ncbi:hypothetical protein SPRG_11871 [Saprolegnia parasitica CBS 223.65]|uniref:Expansin-like EG45 domain-containing protein n=1 Tax=Saprolegnia parasitica (strain CBS 223.65) TaxID=695850 RepID=A0A067BWW1_SAPPC|nr:hypothetical protein SPRG_11871 [Saprolegnia parasitica CBS 223.65]KDO23024.1 hypothetical protein SPRG_11871 [Saprolegnia parasitica CBS 223.65]|eukprot:XP_012206312.1 hypothetical protein SPRG_11871 [Saprolegnia parasitica CBS 223.65]